MLGGGPVGVELAAAQNVEARPGECHVDPGCTDHPQRTEVAVLHLILRALLQPARGFAAVHNCFEQLFECEHLFGRRNLRAQCLQPLPRLLAILAEPDKHKRLVILLEARHDVALDIAEVEIH